jgi:hypothetical protein
MDISDRNRELLRKDPYGDTALTAAEESARRLRKKFGHHTGVVGIFPGYYHGSLELHVQYLTEEYADHLEDVLPTEFEGFGVRSHAPLWGIGELCTEDRQKVVDSGILVHGSKKCVDQREFYSNVAAKEKKIWASMSSPERREFIDGLLADRKKQGNCYNNWRMRDF